MAALSAVVFTLSGWLGLYLLARDPRKPVLALAAIGLCGFALVVALDAVRTVSAAHAQLLSQLEIYLVAVPGVAWFAVLSSCPGPATVGAARTASCSLVAGVAALTLFGAAMAGQRRRARCGRALADVRGDLGVHAGRDGRRGAAAAPSRCRWSGWLSSWRRCSSRWPTRS